MAYQGVIFDLDGTLLDTVEDIADSVNHALEEFGLPTYQLANYKGLVGAGLDQLLNDVLEEKANDRDFFNAFKKRVRNIYRERWHLKSRPYEGIPELLEQLKTMRLPRAVLSNKYHEGTTMIVDHFFRQWQMNPVMGSRDGMPLKPDPTPAMEMARLMEMKPEYLIYLGDTGSDIQTAIKAGMLPIGVDWGFRPVKELKEAGAKDVIRTPQDILAFLS